MNVRQVLPRDAIPSVDDPAFVETYFGDPGESVIVIDRSTIGGRRTDESRASEDEPAAGTAGVQPRAYPLRILNAHEIVNDVVDGVPIAVTWCPLCGSAVVYDRRVEGRTLEFGVSGKLADDDLVMYDRETGSEWKQSLGECIAGPLEGARLTVLPAAVTTWERFREHNPDGVVLARPGGDGAAGGGGSDPDLDPEHLEYEADPYREYFDSDRIGLAARRGDEGRQWSREDLAPKAVVLGIERGDEALGFPLPWVEDAGGVMTGSVGGTDVVAFATPDGIHAFEHPGYDFDPAGDGSYRADGTTWDGSTGEAADGRRLTRLPAKRLFAFAWQDDHGPTAFVRRPGPR